MYLTKIWCKHDIGQEGIVFYTKEDARKWLENVVPTFLEETLEELESDGLVNYDTIWLSPPKQLKESE